jgi:membrane peptidoglycan carboxypeptidase
MFNTLKGISCTGSLEYNLFFSINTRNPDSLVFDSDMKRKNFTIRKYGAENYERMNGPFVYEAYDKNRFVRNIDVSTANPAFTQLTHISEYLVKSVLQSEDPSFMLHRGFLLEAFRESIVKNYKERRFARGGSTISMQLVKNVFLSRDKTVSRKAEEALIVYLIENLHLVNKERMLEVYLNVIEWGPNIYGVGEASRFYFNKPPSALSLQESIFLAGIIPRPKAFKYQFDQEGNLKPYLAGYFRILTGRMAFKGWISPQDTTGLQPNVKLTGPALRMVVPVDTVIDEAGDDIIE